MTYFISRESTRGPPLALGQGPRPRTALAAPLPEALRWPNYTAHMGWRSGLAERWRSGGGAAYGRGSGAVGSDKTAKSIAYKYVY